MKTIKFNTATDYLVLQFSNNSKMTVEVKDRIRESLGKSLPEAQGRIVILGSDEKLVVLSASSD
ncbi:hypothetical protein [Methylocystis sp. S23]